MSIIDPKYAQKYKDRPKDWPSQVIDQFATSAVTREKTVTDAEGNKTTETVETKKRSVNLDGLFALAKANKIDTKELEAQRDRKNAPGRIRMTLGNSLRAAARKRHGLYDPNGEWLEAPAEFVGENPLKENRDGTKIQTAKAEPAATDGDQTETEEDETESEDSAA